MPVSGDVGWNQDNRLFRPASDFEGKPEAFLDAPRFDLQPVFGHGRFPNVVVATDGTILAFFGELSVRRSRDGGQNWDPAVVIAKGFAGGGVIVDEVSREILVFVEKAHPPAPLEIFVSADHGVTWNKRDFVIHPNSLGHVPSMHMNEHGICLRHGRYKGRLIRSTRWYGRSNYPEEMFHTHYTNAMFSDDGGRSWQASEPVPLMGCGEAGIVELSDGTLHYNTRRHWAPTRPEALSRWYASSPDGGATWGKAQPSAVLPDGNTNSTYGLMGGLARLPILGRDVLVFSNLIHDQARRNGHVWVSFDGGATWPLRRRVFEGNFAYSSLDAGRPGTASEGWIYLLFEGGGAAGSMARFNLSWLLGGEPTGNGEIPYWAGRR